jgi:hypothetical protein
MDSFERRLEGIRMRAVIQVASLFACAFVSSAQITATIHHLPDGMDEIRVRNGSETNLTAFVVTAKQIPWGGPNTSSPFVIIHSDPLVEPAAQPLPAGEERVVIKRGAPPSRDRRHQHLFEEPVIAAGIFDDGSTTGTPALLSRILLRRSNALLALETAIEALSYAGKRNVPREQLVAQFQKMAVALNRWYVPSEQQIGIQVYQPIVGKLMNLPEIQLGSPFPPADFVERELAALNRQRVTLLESQPSLADGVLLSTP